MSDDARVSGEIRIDPPISQKARLTILRVLDFKDIDLKIDDETGNGVAIVSSYSSCRYLLEEIQEIVDTFGGAGRQFTGFLHVVWGTGSDTDIYRVIVRNGKAIEVRPQILWPVDAMTPEEVATELTQQEQRHNEANKRLRSELLGEFD